MSTHTFKFLEIFPNYDSFKETILAQTILEESEIDEATLKYFWAIMYRSFGNVEVMYTVKQDFIDRFLNELEDLFTKVKRERELVAKIHQLTDEEIAVVSESVNNFANNPNDLPEDPTQPLEYISNQNWGRIANGKFTAYLQALNNIPSYRIGSIIRQFRPLFWDSLPNTIYIYPQEK